MHFAGARPLLIPPHHTDLSFYCELLVLSCQHHNYMSYCLELKTVSFLQYKYGTYFCHDIYDYLYQSIQRLGFLHDSSLNAQAISLVMVTPGRQDFSSSTSSLSERFSLQASSSALSANEISSSSLFFLGQREVSSSSTLFRETG